VEPGPLHNTFIGNSSAVRHGRRLDGCGFCYDEGVVKRQAGRVGGEFIKHVLPAILKPARSLWNEVIGFIFLSMGAIFGARTVGFAMNGDFWRVLLMGTGAAVMLWFGITSFVKARRISRS
jgi:hypothetical protein